MSKIGNLKTVMNGSKEELHGEVSTLQMQLKIKLLPNAGKTSENAPDYIVAANGYSGVDIPIGGAWKKTKSKIGGNDFEFLSITIDDPSLPNPLNVAAFKNNEGGWDITWRRRQSAEPISKTSENQLNAINA
jgi:uncharacterized protein (DUF736 family)